jgi:hypothetical protein
MNGLFGGAKYAGSLANTRLEYDPVLGPGDHVSVRVKEDPGAALFGNKALLSPAQILLGLNISCEQWSRLSGSYKLARISSTWPSYPNDSYAFMVAQTDAECARQRTATYTPVNTTASKDTRDYDRYFGTSGLYGLTQVKDFDPFIGYRVEDALLRLGLTCSQWARLSPATQLARVSYIYPKSNQDWYNYVVQDLNRHCATMQSPMYPSYPAGAADAPPTDAPPADAPPVILPTVVTPSPPPPSIWKTLIVGVIAGAVAGAATGAMTGAVAGVVTRR